MSVCNLRPRIYAKAFASSTMLGCAMGAMCCKVTCTPRQFSCTGFTNSAFRLIIFAGILGCPRQVNTKPKKRSRVENSSKGFHFFRGFRRFLTLYQFGAEPGDAPFFGFVQTGRRLREPVGQSKKALAAMSHDLISIGAIPSPPRINSRKLRSERK